MSVLNELNFTMLEQLDQELGVDRDFSRWVSIIKWQFFWFAIFLVRLLNLLCSKKVQH